MKQHTPIKSAKRGRLFLAMLMLMSFTGLSSLFAQPTNYCVPYPNGATYEYCYSYYAYPTEVKVTDVAANTVIFDRVSGDDGCFYFAGETMNMKLGKTYKIDIQVYQTYYYYNTTRLFIDWNMNGVLGGVDAGEYYSFSRLYGSGTMNYTTTITVPCTVPIGLTRMRVLSAYYYDQGNNACRNGYYYDGGSYQYSYCYGGAEDYLINFVADVEAVYPPQDGIILAATVYDGTTRAGVTYPKPMARMGQTQPAGAILKYQITGPRPSTNMVYEGLNPTNGTTSIDMGGYRQYDMQKARGIYSYPSGASDGSFYSENGGEYKVGVSVSGSGCPGSSYSTFTVSWPRDMAANSIVSPYNNSAPRFHKYLRNNIISVSGIFQNVGTNNVSAFWAYAYVLNAAGDTVFRFAKHYDANNNPGDVVLTPTRKTQIDFGTMRINSVGTFRMVMKVDYSPADMEAYNDIIPRPDDPDYIFEVAYEIELTSNKMLRPAQGEVVIGNRPVIPIGEFKNVGVYDASDVPAKLTIRKLPDRTVAYTSNVTVQDVPAGKYNTKQNSFDVMTLRETGSYEAELIISHTDDALRSDDTIRSNFTVDGGLQGTYTVGAGGNFPTIDSVMNVLYYRGLAGPVTFLLTDSYYMVKGKNVQDPAWDFTTYIINLGWDDKYQRYNTITWKPSPLMAVSKGSITIDMYAPNGKGIVFGQSMNNSNTYSIYNQYSAYASISRKYVNSPGYITIDGGSQQSIKFKINSYSKATAQAIYLSRGSKNIEVSNCLIENATTTLSCASWMPMTNYNPSAGFTFQADTLVSGGVTYGYSAGIVNRSSLFGTEAAQLMHVDTIPNTNNKFNNNEIYGFGYGIMSIGIGQLLLENVGDYGRFYNTNNTITNNTIHDVCRFGIFAGYEENSTITGNRIYNVTSTNNANIGIAAGGEGSSQYKGYNNINLNIQGNEISGVKSAISAVGIKVEQARNTFQHPSKGQVFFPNVPEASKVTNNTIWGVTTTATSANRGGIHMLTERSTDLLTPSVPSYFSQNDMVVNNTVVLGSNNGIATTGFISGIALQNLTGAVLKNNAVALTDIGVSSSCPVYSGFLYQGPMPATGSLTSDRNAFYAPSNANASFYKFVETSNAGVILDAGNRDDYNTLDQWRNWTKQDKNSIVGNFTTDLVYLGSEPNQKLRVQTLPLTPIGSVLNNRGERILSLTTDIDGDLRGTAGQKYDIGADEFAGRLWVSDVEALSIVSPAAYKTGSGVYSDAEYIMTTSPVEVKAYVRNSGNLQQTGVTFNINIYRELPNGLFSTTPEVTTTATATIAPGDAVEVPFLLADKQGTEFAPKTYGMLRGTGYVMPTQFTSMEANVTPKYRMVVSIGADQYNSNNIMEKIVRFYIRKSDMRIVLSAVNSMTTLDANSTADQIAGRLNADSLRKAMSRVGWIVDISKNRYDYDIFDRLGWESKAVDYTMYRTMWYADGNEGMYSRYQRQDILNFLNIGNQIEKRNLILGSQEVVRNHGNSADATNYDANFVGNVLRATAKSPYNPKGAGVSNDGNSVMGIALHRSLTEGIVKTGWATDAAPFCGLLGVNPVGEGLAQATAFYTNHSGSLTDSIEGIATSTLNRNIVLHSVDWRHWVRADYIIRASIDYIEKNGGTIIPVELLSFEANQMNNTVQLNWQTATEYQTDRFEIERAIKSDAGITAFTKIAEEKAAGTSSSEKSYGPIVDRTVSIGNVYVYRLKMVDLNGEFKYSEQKEVKVGGENAMWLGVNMPNPAVSSTDMQFSVDNTGNVEFVLFDMTGKLVKTIFTGSVNAGIQTLTINTSDVPAGSYNVIMKQADRTVVRTIQVVK